MNRDIFLFSATGSCFFIIHKIRNAYPFYILAPKQENKMY